MGRVRRHTLRDDNLPNLRETVEVGFQGSGSCPGYTGILPIQGWTQNGRWGDSIQNRTVVASRLGALILDTLHSAHQGVSCMTSRAESSEYPVSVMQRECTQLAVLSSACGSGTGLSFPLYMFELLQAQWLQLRGGCGPLLWLADCAAITRWFFGSYRMPSQNVRHIRIADEISSDGGPELSAEETQQLLSNWSVHHRLSSVALAHSNGRAKLEVKTCKRVLMDKTGPNSEINLDKFQRGILQDRNRLRYRLITSTDDIWTTHKGLHSH